MTNELTRPLTGAEERLWQEKLAALLESKGVETTLKDYPKYNGKSLAHVYSVLFPFDEAGSEMIDGAIDFYREILSR